MISSSATYTVEKTVPFGSPAGSSTAHRRFSLRSPVLGLRQPPGLHCSFALLTRRAVDALVTLRTAGSGTRAARRRRRARRGGGADTRRGSASNAKRPCSPASADQSRSPWTSRIARATASTHPSTRREPSSVAVTCSEHVRVAVAELQRRGVGLAAHGGERRPFDERQQRVLAGQVLDGDRGDHAVDEVGRHRIHLLPHRAKSREERRIRGEVLSVHRRPLPIRRPRVRRGAWRDSAGGSVRWTRSASRDPQRCAHSRAVPRTRRSAAGAGIVR